MANVLIASVVDRMFEPQSGQTKNYKIGICCFSITHASLMRKTKYLAQNQDSVSKWSDKLIEDVVSVCQHYNNPTKSVAIVQSGYHHHCHH